MLPMNKEERGFVAGLTEKDFATIALNVQYMRAINGWTQTELVERSGVSRTTLRRIESGLPAFGQTLSKLARAFKVPVSDLVLMRRFRAILGEENRYVIHRNADDDWFAIEDKRTKKPSDSRDLVQHPAERRRLGELGFVPAFGCGMEFFLPNGPGINRLELYGRFEDPRMLQFHVNTLHCLVGEIRIAWSDDQVILRPNEVIAFRTKDPLFIEPVRREGLAWPAIALVTGADRRKVDWDA